MTMAQTRTPTGFVFLAALLFFLSGGLGLGYELVWVHKAQQIVGSSQVALSTVLTSFFLGLALGSLVVGRYLRSPRWSPLFIYGLFEAAIGLFALAFPFLFELVADGYGTLYPVFRDSAVGLFLLRFLLLFLLFLLPTFFMGGTLPLLLDGIVDRDRAVGPLSAFLYGLNILGAVCGVLLTGYFAIPELGMNTTSLFGGVGNLAIAATALVLFRNARPLHQPEVTASRTAIPVFFVVASLASGFAAIGYQIAWARYFSLFNSGDVYLTTLLLAVFLLALSIGSMLLAPLLRLKLRPLSLLAVSQPLVPVFLFACLHWWPAAVLEFRPDGAEKSFETVANWSLLNPTVDAIFLGPLAQVALVLFIPVMLLGIGLPGLIAGATHRSPELRKISGTLLFWNTIGSSAGGFVAGYVLIPGLGLTLTVFTLGLVSIAIGAAAHWRAGTEGRLRGFDLSRAGRSFGYGVSILAFALVFFSMKEDISTRTILDYGKGAYLKKIKAFDEMNDETEVVEGPLTTAYVLDGKRQKFIGSGGVIVAVASRDTLSYQLVQGHIPALFYPKQSAPERILGIALGSGQSFGAMLLHPIKQMDVVDISQAMIDLSLKHFSDFNHKLAEDPRVTIHLDDGRHFAERAADNTYDVVSMEPPPPTAEGIYRLYSLEFYQTVRRILRDKGVFTQWLPIYFVTPNDLQGIIKTQAEVFPYTFVVKVGPEDFAVVSFKTNEPPRIDPEWIKERAKIFARERGLEEARWTIDSLHDVASLEGILALLFTGPDDIARMKAPFLHMDENQRLQYSSGDRDLLRRRLPVERLSFAALPMTPFDDLARYFTEPLPASELEEERTRSMLESYGLTSPELLEGAADRFTEESDPAEKAQLAMLIAERFDWRLAKREALAWVAKAVVAYPEDDRPEQIARAQGIAQHAIAIYAAELRQWLRTVNGNTAPVLEAMKQTLAAYDEREARRNARYLWP